MIALLRREFRSALLWAVLYGLVGLLGNADHLLFKTPDEVDALSLHVFEPRGSVALGLVELVLAFTMAQRVLIREVEDGSVGALDALPVSRAEVYFAKVLTCAAMLGWGAAVLFVANLALTIVARSSVSPSLQTQAHALFALQSLGVGALGVALGAATAPWRGVAFVSLGVMAALVTLIEHVAPSTRAWNPLSLHVSARMDGRWLVPWGGLARQGLLALALLVFAGWRYARLARKGVSDAGPGKSPWRVVGLVAAVLAMPLVCLMGLAVVGSSTMNVRVPTRRYVFVIPRTEQESAAALTARADELFERVRVRFGVEPPLPLVVDATQSLRHLGRAGQASGLSVSLDRSVLGSPTRAPEVLVHETTHTLADYVSGWRLASEGRSTKVFNEGFAMTLEHDLVGEAPGATDDLVLATLHHRGLLRAELFVDYEAVERAHDPNLAYPLGETFVRAMMDAYGEDAPVRVLRAFGRRERGWHLEGEALWREVMLDAGMSYDLVVGRAFARLDAMTSRMEPEVRSVPALRAVVSVTRDTVIVRVERERYDAGAAGTVELSSGVRVVCRFRDPTETSVDRYFVTYEPCSMPRRHFAGPSVQVQLGAVVPHGEHGSDERADVVYDPWVDVRTE